MPATPPCRIVPLGDRGLVIDWGNRIDETLNRQVLALWERLRRASLPGVSDIIPAYSSLTIIFDSDIPPLAAANPQAGLSHLIARLFAEPPATIEIPGRSMRIPVCYDPSLAPDLPAIAARSGLSIAEVVQLHTATEYRVFMLGFLPGFPYMGTVDARIAAPRLAQPRLRVPAGSVGIAGAQTGIYPLESPGGWNLIGRTPLRIFNAQNESPTLLQPGDRVRFFPVSPQEFHQIHRQS